MKKMKKQMLCLILALMSLVGLASCGQLEQDVTETEVASTESRIQSVDDLSGSRIGVQLGTTGDIYVSDYERDGSGTIIERYNKGADAIQALKQGKIDCVVIDEQPAIKFVE